MMGHVLFHDFCGIMVLQNHPFLECGIETEVFGVREPDEVRGSVIGVVAVQMMTLMVEATGTDPSDSDKKMTIRSTSEVSHPRIVGMDVGFATEILRHVGLVRGQSSGRKRVEQPGL